MPADAAPPQDVKRKAAREVIDILHEIATLLVRVSRHQHHAQQPTNTMQNTKLDRQQLSYCVSLIENGANPEALAVRRPDRNAMPCTCYLRSQHVRRVSMHTDNAAECHPRAARRVRHRLGRRRRRRTRCTLSWPAITISSTSSSPSRFGSTCCRSGSAPRQASIWNSQCVALATIGELASTSSLIGSVLTPEVRAHAHYNAGHNAPTEGHSTHGAHGYLALRMTR
jgi:mitotic-spindle organizing protein 1